MTNERIRSPGLAFLLSQLGAHSSKVWAERLAKLGLETREVMLFRHVALAAGRSQREVAEAIGLPESRIVALVDRLEARGWIERRISSADRRSRALHLTREGQTALDKIMVVSTEHEADLTDGLGPQERAKLLALLERVAQRQGLIAGVHPGFAEPTADLTRRRSAESDAAGRRDTIEPE